MNENNQTPVTVATQILQTKTFRKGQKITPLDERFARSVKRAFKATKKSHPYMSMALVSNLLGFHEDWMRRIVSLTERPSRESALDLAEAVGFSEGQMKYHKSYFANLPSKNQKTTAPLA